jgi:ribosome-associated protein
MLLDGVTINDGKDSLAGIVRRQSASIEASLVRARLERLAGRRLTREGVLVINARRHRTQERNREDARECLFDLIRRAALAPRARRSTKPTAAARERRLDSKKRHAAIKGLRRAKPPLD